MTPTLHSQTLWKIILSVYLQWTKLSYHMHLIVHMHIIWVQNNWLSCKKVLQWKYLAKWVSVTLSLHAESNHGPLHYEWNANPNLSGLVFLWNEQGFVITCTWLYTSYAHHEGPKQLMELQKGLTEGTCSKMYICQPTRGIEPRTFSLRMKCSATELYGQFGAYQESNPGQMLQTHSSYHDTIGADFTSWAHPCLLTSGVWNQDLLHPKQESYY